MAPVLGEQLRSGRLLSRLTRSALLWLYHRSPKVQKFVLPLRRPASVWAASAGGPPFLGDACLRETVDFLLAECEITSFVETGTYLGHTCRYVASRYPSLPVLTLEVTRDYFEASRRTFRRYKNVTQVLGDSAQTLPQALQHGTIKGFPVFFLDAHWYGYMPLPAEIQSIGRQLPMAVMVIHDFEVPGRDDYGFDACNGQAIGMEMLRAGLAADKNYQLFLPRYSFEEAYRSAPVQRQPLRGHALVFQGAPLAAAKFGGSELARRYMRQTLSRLPDQ